MRGHVIFSRYFRIIAVENCLTANGRNVFFSQHAHTHEHRHVQTQIDTHATDEYAV